MTNQWTLSANGTALSSESEVNTAIGTQIAGAFIAYQDTTSANGIVVLLIFFNPERLNIFSKNYRLSTRCNAFLYVVTPNISC